MLTLLRHKKTIHDIKTAGAQREVWVLRCLQRPEQESSSGQGGRGGHRDTSVRAGLKTGKHGSFSRKCAKRLLKVDGSGGDEHERDLWTYLGQLGNGIEVKKRIKSGFIL